MRSAWPEMRPAYLKIGKTGRGEFAFGAVQATVKLAYGRYIVFFRCIGFDDDLKVFQPKV
jgi:hypothetical protein